MSSLFLPSSLDWPLSRDERKRRVLQCYDNEVRATQQLLNSSCSSKGLARHTVSAPCSSELKLPCPQIPVSAVAKAIRTDVPGLDAEVWRQAVEAAFLMMAASGSCARAEGSIAEACVAASRARCEYPQLHDCVRRARSGPERCSSELELRKGRRCRDPSRARCSAFSPATRKTNRACSGPDGLGALKVGFKDDLCQYALEGDCTDSDNGLDQRRKWVSAGVVAGRHRLSRGPDGAPVRIHAYRINSDSESESATDATYPDSVEICAEAGNFVTASIMAGAVAGGATGMMTGGAMGATVGLGGVLLTFGLSVPIGAMIGGSTGLFAGSALGSAVGYVHSTGRIEAITSRHAES